jgi:hypothetical protein
MEVSVQLHAPANLLPVPIRWKAMNYNEKQFDKVEGLFSMELVS